MTCRARKLEADGRVVACELDMWGHTNPRRNVYGLHCGGRSWWAAGDPCAWDATCPECDGAGELTDCGSLIPCPTCDWEAVPCEACGGTGTVDDPPARLIGVGSVVTYRGHTRLVEATDGDGLFLLRDHELLGWHVRWDDRDDTWRLLRAVPPAATPHGDHR